MTAPKDGSENAAGERLRLLRNEIANQGLDGFIVPRADEHQGEYVPSCAERLAWLTGFNGSAGLAVILPETAALFVDGRYTLQAADQLDPALYEIRHVVREPPGKWLAEQMGPGSRIGFDSRLHTPNQLEALKPALARTEVVLVAAADNPLDAVWHDRPSPPDAPFVEHPIEYAGRAASDKRREIAARLTADEIDAAVLTLPDSIAWLLNIRGSDVPHSPLPLSYAIVHADARVVLFAAKDRIDAALSAHLGQDVRIAPPDDLARELAGLGGKRALVDPASASVWFFDRLEAAGANIVRAPDPCQLPKACKNHVEIAGARNAHLRDGTALTRFLHWIATEAQDGSIGELEAAERLRAFREETGALQDLSFETISGAGPNGAIVHYRVSPDSSRPLKPGTLYLVDSGGQYLDGTTDVTRTVAIGEPTSEMREHFTRVLKGHIALASARFPEGTTGSQLDTLARAPLWQAGMDYDHGTGHGVGSFLAVHEGPQRISKMPSPVAIQPGMIVSNEPGFYRTGHYGIRIENLVVATVVEEGGDDRPDLLGFETLTLAPIDLRLVNPTLLGEKEVAWLDAYHADVWQRVGPQLDGPAKDWLEAVSRPVRG